MFIATVRDLNVGPIPELPTMYAAEVLDTSTQQFLHVRYTPITVDSTPEIDIQPVRLIPTPAGVGDPDETMAAIQADLQPMQEHAGLNVQVFPLRDGVQVVPPAA